MSYAWVRACSIDHTQVGGSDLASMVACVRGTFADLASTANGGTMRADVLDAAVFADAGLTTPLPWTRDRWNPVTGEIVLHVKTPASASVNTIVYLAYSDPAVATDQSNPHGTWDANYKARYALGDGTTLSGADSTSNALNLTNAGATAVNSDLGGKASFNGAATLGAATPAMTVTDNFEIACKVTPATGFNANGTMVENGHETGAVGDGYALGVGNGLGTGRLSALFDGVAAVDSGVTLVLGTEYLISLVREAGVTKFYVNNVQTSGTDSTHAPVTPTGGTNIGSLQPWNASNVFFAGTIDEVRISNIVRNATRTADYNNLKTGSTFVTVGAATANGGPPAPATSYTLTGPSAGLVGVASSPFTVTPNGDATGDVITFHSSGAGTFSPPFVTLSGSASATAVYTPSSTAGSPHAISTTNSSTLTNPASVNYTVNSFTPGAINDPSLFFPAQSWRKSGSTAIANTTDAYIKTNFTGATLGLAVDVSVLVANSVLAANYPVIAYSIDGAAYTYRQLLSSDATISLASGLAAGTHSVEVILVALSPDTTDRWTTPVMALRTTGFVLAAGGACSAPTLRPKRMIFYGPSTTEGLQVLSGSNQAPASNDSSQSWQHDFARALDCEYSNRSFAGMGYEIAPTVFNAVVNVPNLVNSWNLYSAGQSLLVAGLYADAPNIIATDMGYNDDTQGVSDATVQARCQTMIANWRAAAPSATILICLPENQHKSAALTAAVAASGDANCFLVDPGENLDIAQWRNAGANGGHFSVRGHARAAAIYAALAQAKIDSLSAGTGRVPQIGSPFLRAAA